MLLSLLFRNLAGSYRVPSQLGILTIDVTIEESHELGAQITDWPIEGGAVITDHVRLEPKTLSITGFVSDTPLNAVGLSLGRSRASSAFFALETMWQARIPLVVVSQLRVYRNMIIESLVVPKQRENAMRFSCVLREISIVSGQNTLLPAAGDVGGANSNAAAVANGGGVAGMSSLNVLRPATDSVGIDAGRQIATAAASSVKSMASSVFGSFN